jgi:integrase
MMEFGEYGKEYRAMVLFAGYVGCRPGEVFALKREDIHGQHCTIERAVNNLGEVGLPKNGRSRTVVIPPKALDALDDVASHRSGLLFTSPQDCRWKKNTHYLYWSMLRKFAGHHGLDFYELRHAAATMLLERGATPWDVAQQLGHLDGGQLVMELYGHPSDAGARSRNLAVWESEIEPLREIKTARG